MTPRAAICVAFFCTGCSFIDDFDDFRIQKSQIEPDAAAPKGDAAIDAGMVLVDCSSAEDGKACGSGGDLICIDRICRASICGDGYIDKVKQEDCEDLNLIAGDGCEPVSCRYSCEKAEECDNAFACDGVETCTDHVCTPGKLASKGTACERLDGVAGACEAGYCIPEGCGNGTLDTDRQEECDGTSGCRPDCTMGCVSDAQCSDDNVCNGIEDCELLSGACQRVDPVPCDDQDPCTRDGPCAPSTGCGFALIDADHDGFAPATCSPGSSFKGDDCDDGDPTVYPGGTEYCDGVDNDCDGMKDESAVKATCYPDADGDGFPVESAPSTACSCPKGTLPERDDGLWDCWDDPDDAGRDVFPGQAMSFASGYNARCASPDGPCKVIKSYDYDCDRREVPFYTEQNRTSCGALGGSLGCTPSGYTGEAPGCGQAGAYLTCRPNGGLLGGCAGLNSELAQLCR